MRFVATSALALTASFLLAGCAPGSEDPEAALDDTQTHESTGLPILAGDEVPPAIAQAAVLHQLLATDEGFDLDAVDAIRTMPVESLEGDVVSYLAIVAPAGQGGDVLDLASRASSGTLRSFITGARLDRSPLSRADASGELAASLGRTLRAIGGRGAVDRLVGVTSTELMIETTSGTLYMVGAETPLSDYERETLDELEKERARIVGEGQAAVKQQLAEAWLPFVHRAADRDYETFVDRDGDLDLGVARETLAKDDVLGRRAMLRQKPAASGEATDKGTQATRNGAQYCAAYFMWQCVEWSYEEVGAYADECITAPNPVTCNGNKTVAAVPHIELKHPIDGYTYAGCGPEAFATLVWQRWHAGQRFGYAAGALANIPQYRNPSGENTIMHEAAHGANRAMGSFPVKDGNIATLPWDFADGANEWLAAHASNDRIAGSWSLLDANGLSSAAKTRADVLHQLVGRGFGPVVALGGLGDTFGSPHYAPVFRYRVTRNPAGVAKSVHVTLDLNQEIDITDPWQYATGVFYFDADLKKAKAN